jgi:hypothetical protein
MLAQVPGWSTAEGPAADAIYDKYGFRINRADTEQLLDQERYYSRYQSVVQTQTEKWTTFLEDNVVGVKQGQGVQPYMPFEARQNKTIDKLARGGVPSERRGFIWFRVSGALAKMEREATSYDSYREAADAESSIAHEEIEKDLKRTFPGHRFIDTEEGLQKLWRVLTAYAARNPKVGYCQSMNYVCALLLLFMAEDEAFWTLATIVEDILPDGFYTNSMAQLMLELQVYDDLVTMHLPRLAQHFARLHIDLQAMCSQWFLLIFVNCLPLETVLRVWDCFFVEGFVAKLRVGLAILKYHEKGLLACSDAGSTMQLLSVMASRTVRCNHLLKLAHEKSWLGQTFRHDVEQLREARCERAASGGLASASGMLTSRPDSGGSDGGRPEVPGQTLGLAASWADDDKADRCMACQTEFTWTNRRHHCRACGRLVCADCSFHRVLLGGVPRWRYQCATHK